MSLPADRSESARVSAGVPAFSELARRLSDVLPSGKSLPPEVWRVRHRFMLVVIWLHLAGLGIAGVATGQNAGQLSFELVPILLCALAAALPTGSRQLRGSMVAFGALYCSGALVNIAQGSTEAHFHFFVMVAMLAAYEEWMPYLLAVGFVVVHHGLVGVLDPSSVYANASAVASPWKWALIHAAFVLGLCVVNVISWRLNENMRAQAADALEQMRRSEAEFRDAFEDAPIGMAIVDLRGRFVRVNRSLSQLTGFPADLLLTMGLTDIAVTPAGASIGTTADESSAFECPLRRADGSSGWGLLQRSVARNAAGEPTHVLLQLLDLTTRKEAERQLAYAADHDELTRLPNRAFFERRANEALAALDPGRSLAVLFVDIDNFKVINDSLGHGAATTCWCWSPNGWAPRSSRRTCSRASAATSSSSSCPRQRRAIAGRWPCAVCARAHPPL